MNFNPFKYLGLASALIMMTSSTAMAVTATGKISLYHLNANVVGRGVCIKMNPSIQSPGNWACLWQSNLLYTEITDLLLEGYSRGKTCSVNWSRNEGGYPYIEWAECS